MEEKNKLNLFHLYFSILEIILYGINNLDWTGMYYVAALQVDAL